MRIDSAIITGSFSVNGDTFNDLGSYSTTGSNTFVGNQSIVGAVSASALTGSINFTNLTGVPTLVSGSEQIVGILSPLNSFSASNSTTNTFTSSATARLNSIETITSSNVARLNSLENKTGSLASTGSNTFIGNQTISGTVYIQNDLIVQGSSSLQNITASAVSIGTNIVNLNTANPSIRFAGLSIVDSGSVGGSGSFLYDSLQDEFIFVHRGTATTVTSSVILMGPQTYDSIGSETYLTNNRLVKGEGNEHLADSNITDNGTLVTINSVTSSFSGLVGIGTTTPTSKLDIYGTSGNANPIFKVIGTSAADSFNYAGTMLNPSLGSGRNYALFIGKALNTKDSAYIGFNHSGTDGSDSNFVNIGHFNNDYMLNIRGNGFVGIGVTNPSQILSVSGSVSLGNLSAALNFTGGGNARFLEIGSSGDALLVTHASGFGVGYFGYQSADDRLVVACDNGAGNNKIDFIVNATSTTGGGTNNLSGVLPAMRINSSGSVGIGTTSITASDVRLEVYKAAVTGNWSPRLVVKDQNFASFLGIFNQKAGVFAHTSALDGWADLYVNTVDGGFGSGNNGKVIFGGMCILANGNVGIGVTDPAWKLHIQGTTGTSIQDALMTLKNTAASNTTGILFVNSGNTSSYNDLAGIYAKIQSGSAKGYLGFYTRNSDASNTDVAERMRISADGYVTKPYQPAFKAGRSSNISVGANSTIVFNDTDGIHFNIGGHYSTSTGLFTAPVAGRYIFSAVVIYQSLSNGQAMDDAFYIYRNSSLVAYSFRRAEYEAGYTGNGAYYVDHANTLLNLAAGDTVSIRNNRALDVHGNTAYTYFYGYMLG